MMKHVKKQNKSKKETLKSSLTFKWVSLVAATITVSFVIFSIAIYSLVKQQIISQERNLTESVATTFQRRLVEIPTSLQISNVVPQLSPNTNRILEGQTPITSNNGGNVFSNGNVPDEGMPQFSKTESHVLKVVTTQGKIHMKVYQKIFSERTHRLTGYLIVDNSMDQQNQVLKSIRHWMISLSVIAIVVFIGLSYLIVNSVVQPIKKMSQISHDINKDPTDKRRVPDLHRNDELGELAISFNKMLDRMQAYMQQQKQFVGDVSHELRTPVAVIEGHLNLLERWGKDDPQVLEESIQASLQESKRMKHLIQEMLDLTRAEQVDLQYPDKTTDVNEVLNRTVNDMRMIHQDFTITYDDADLKPDTIVKIYRNHLEQILIILIDNAIKYSTDRKEILVAAATEEDKVKILVQDFGEGIAPDEQDKIFNRFYRVDKARTREKGGNGLGLAIAQKLVESYHGKISVSSTLGSGSKFMIEFPLLKSESDK